MQKRKIESEEEDENYEISNNSNNDLTSKSDYSSKKKNFKGERILVFVRIRPFIPSEIELDDSSPIEMLDTNKNAMTCKKTSNNKLYKYS